MNEWTRLSKPGLRRLPDTRHAYDTHVGLRSADLITTAEEIPPDVCAGRSQNHADVFTRCPVTTWCESVQPSRWNQDADQQFAALVAIGVFCDGLCVRAGA